MCIRDRAQRYRSGPILYCLDLFFLTTGLIKAYARVILIAFFSCNTFFYPAACMFPDGYECWEPAHVVFTTYVMERVEQNRTSTGQEQKHSSRQWMSGEEDAVAGGGTAADAAAALAPAPDAAATPTAPAPA